jgi:hypothetical protein
MAGIRFERPHTGTFLSTVYFERACAFAVRAIPVRITEDGAIVSRMQPT